MLDWLTGIIGRMLAVYLSKPIRRYEPFSVHNTETLSSILEPGDILLVEGNLRFSTAIKYLTQSTWSHAALFVGDALKDSQCGGEPCELIEADLLDGVIAVPVSKYAHFNTRIVRPVGLTQKDRDAVVQFMVQGLGKSYDQKHIIDLVRYLLPTPPVPMRFRRRMLALGSGDPTRAICSALIAQAYQLVRYPILPCVERRAARSPCAHTESEILHIRHHSLFTPRDFDVSPYFQIVKPTLERGFCYKELAWADLEEPRAVKRSAV
ncbi:MAG: YiiX/YebB-like N1pC/P60 family cysteine hydrolase [Acidiferrobacterales bacterium]